MIEFGLEKSLEGPRGRFRLEVEERVAPHESVAVFGPSGSGKTSILRMIAGLLRPDAGRIVVDGKIWFDSAAGIDLPARVRRAGMVFQDYALFPHMTVEGNLRYAAADRRELESIPRILEFTGLSGLAARMPSSLSGGQKQRVALARALVARPPLLLLDEPLSALDPELRSQLQRELSRIRSEFGVPMLLVSHDVSEVVRLCGRVVRLDEGKVIARGTPAAVFSQGRLSAKFRLHAEVLSLEPADALVRVSLLAGGDVVEVALLPEETEGLRPGDRVMVGTKAFQPSLWRMEG
jgi:molybdate transport system ATP-binding protein